MKPIFILLFATALVATQQIFAVPAYPNPINYTLPDGTEITIQLRGDEWLNWAETPDGFTLLRNSEGFFEYATLNELGDLALSGVRVNDMSRRTSGEQDFLHTLERGLMFSEFQIERKLEFRRIRDEFLQEDAGEGLQRVSGSVRIPVVLVGFSNRPFTRSRAEIQMLFNQLNHTGTGIVGSVRDYFLDVSGGQMDLQAEILGPFTLPNTIEFYAGSSGTANTRLMATQAVDLAFQNGANFSTFHTRMVGGVRTLSTVHLIFAGHCRAAGAAAGHNIWSHRWVLSTARTYNGVRIWDYCTSPEYRGLSGTLPGTIGTAVHELGHSILGWPDSYSVVSNPINRCVDLGDWCVMASGVWLGNPAASRPSRPSAWFVVDAGWTPEILLSTSQNVTMQTGTVFRINTTTTNEYFLLENRQRVGWDALIPASGMLIYHVDRTSGANSDWNNNRILSNCNRRRLYIKQAGCATANGCAANRQNDVWPRAGFTEFTDNSTPNARSWAGANTNRPVTNITHNAIAGTVSFMFMPPPPILTGPTFICTSAVFNIENFPAGATVAWAVSPGLTVSGNGSSVTVSRPSWIDSHFNAWVRATITVPGRPATVLQRSIPVVWRSGTQYGLSITGSYWTTGGTFEMFTGGLSGWTIGHNFHWTTDAPWQAHFQGAWFTDFSGSEAHSPFWITVNFTDVCGGFSTVFQQFWPHSPWSGNIGMVYPNPVSDILNIEIGTKTTKIPFRSDIVISDNVYEIRLYNDRGNLVRQMTTRGGAIQLDVSNLPTGVYSLHIHDGVSCSPDVRQIIIRR